jgi:hypothetical protein
MTISGYGFSGKGTPTLQFSGAGISTVNPSVVNDTTIQAGYAVSCSAGSQNVTVVFASDGNMQTNAWPLSVALPAAPTPTIQLAGQNISGTPSVVVGQQIALSASVSLPSCMSFSSQSWSIPPGTAVGGYVNAAGNGPPDTTGGQVAALPPNTTSGSLPLGYTFYWVYPGSSLQMSYQYTMSGGFGSVNSPIATATFNVAGPTPSPTSNSPYVTTQLGNVAINSGPVLQFGSTTGSNIGIAFSASANQPSGYSPTFKWVNLISGDTITLTPNTGSQVTCHLGAGLDNKYPSFPLVTSNTTNDNPKYGPLPSGYTEVNRNFSAQTYLMWNSGLANAIDVPLGSLPWGFVGDAVLVAGTWNIDQSKSSKYATGFTNSPSYPTWNSLYLNGSVPCP